MRFGITGFPKTGKTTLFNMLTGAEAAVGPYSQPGKKNVGVARVPDPRLDVLEKMYVAKKKTFATVEYLDVPGIEKGQAASAFDLAELRNLDGLVHVVRAFEDPAIPHSEGAVDPRRDVETMEMELQFADLGFLENRIEKAKGEYMRSKAKPLEREIPLLEKGKAALEAGTPLRAAGYSKDDLAILRGYALLSLKPVLHAVNVGEETAAHASDAVAFFGLGEHAFREGTGVVGFCGTLEAEIGRLDPEDAAAFRADAGLREPGLDRILQACYRLLDVISFLTAGEKEVRAWTVRRGAHAPEAAGKIHSDLEKGFIRAEVVPYDDLVAAGSTAAARDKGTLRVEGKDYEVRDGDVVLFRFNV